LISVCKVVQAETASRAKHFKVYTLGLFLAGFGQGFSLAP